MVSPDYHIMPSRFTQEPEPERKARPEPSKEPGIDSSKRYDVYCTMRTGANVVYRNVLIKRATPLLVSDEGYSRIGEFFELEGTDGKLVLVSRMSVEAVCEHGTPLPAEPISFNPDER
jgi:hypothetical protein